MTVIHAVLFGKKDSASIAMGRGKVNELFSGIMPLAGDEHSGLPTLLSAFGDRLDPQNGNEKKNTVEKEGELDLAVNLNPRLLVFKFDGILWVARGFRPWGSIEGGDEPEVLILASLAMGTNDHEKKAEAAEILREFAGQPPSGREGNIPRDEMEKIEGSVAFTGGEIGSGLLDPGVGRVQNFANAEDGGN